MNAEKAEAEFEPYGLLQKDGNAPGGKKRVEQAAVKPAHHHPLDHQAEQGGHDKS
ncbi:hypothetical protein D3C71_2175950 [compost metagenome]